MRRCVFSWVACLKVLEQKMQTNGFSPLWIFSCLRRLLASLNSLLHSVHDSDSSSISDGSCSPTSPPSSSSSSSSSSSAPNEPLSSPSSAVVFLGLPLPLPLPRPLPRPRPLRPSPLLSRGFLAGDSSSCEGLQSAEVSPKSFTLVSESSKDRSSLVKPPLPLPRPLPLPLPLPL